MLKWFNKNKEKKNKGFTLVELIVVITILAILVGLLAPQYTKYVEKSRKSADVSNLENLVTGLKVAASDHEYTLGSPDAAVTYTIAISDKGADLQSSDKTLGITSAAKALKEYAGYDLSDEGDKGKLITKSKKWGTDSTVQIEGASSEIYATVTINDDDSVEVAYSANVVNYSDHGTTTSNTTTSSEDTKKQS